MLAEAVARIAATDPALAGAQPTKWLLITEHERAEGAGRTLSVFRSPDQLPWDTLGLLRFASLQEEQSAVYGDDDDEDDE